MWGQRTLYAAAQTAMECAHSAARRAHCIHVGEIGRYRNYRSSSSSPQLPPLNLDAVSQGGSWLIQGFEQQGRCLTNSGFKFDDDDDEDDDDDDEVMLNVLGCQLTY